ncbi:Tex family protein [Fusobacterium sp.]|uniref:Tex family protein n=1 Tax=Fusobacterium sp. TaxID=68766 RepID=UPI001D9A3418|nr:Tex family protein [Fusobacterium sp.]MBS5789160.1 RNA-binding transcriptional accessory protein [Fusobacterium sp.]
MEKIFETVAKELKLKVNQVTNTMQLLDEGATVPFVSRYRKEVTGNLDEIEIGKILESVTYLRNLEKRKEEVIRLIEEQGKLTEELRKSIEDAEKLQEVEDIYFPYRKKRKTKADIAKERGLEPLADIMLKAKSVEELVEKAQGFLTEDIKTVDEALDGAMLIIAQNISETPTYRELIREIMLKYGILVTKESKKAKELDVKKVYGDYYDYSEPVTKMPPHRILAVNRGEKEDILSVNITLDEKTRARVENLILKDFLNKNLKDIYLKIVVDSLDRLILPSIEREVRNILTDKAELEAIAVFKDNLKNLLLQAPLKEKSILALDPGYRTGCKVAVIDKNGFYRENDVFFLVGEMHSPKQLAEAEKKIIDYVNKYKIDIIVMGNGTASRETESFVADVIKKNKLDVKYLIANEAGASIYSASKIAAEEFPDLDVTVRGAISIGRRVQDPLAELVKIDPKSIGVGMYQHDVNQGRLDESLDSVINYVVNSVGANLNTASWALLSHISGIKKNIAKNIVEYRKENGNFKNRKELMKVKGIGAKAYEQMAGFLVIPEGENVLDNTIIHPESYHIAKEILETVGFTVEKYGEDLTGAREQLKNFKAEKFTKENGYGEETVKDIYQALIRDRRDPRDSFEKPLLKSDILKIENLQIGMEIEGTVRNVVKFGAFVDIGLKNDALLHISEISNKFVDDPSKVLSVGQIIKVRIKDIDKERERVALTKKEK